MNQGSQRPQAGSPYDPESYNYELPCERIASRPIVPRHDARLLVLRRNGPGLEHRRVRELPDLLEPGDLLVVNETKVLPARLHGKLAGSDRPVELLLVRELSPGSWFVLLRPAKVAKPGARIDFGAKDRMATVENREGEGARVRFDCEIDRLLSDSGHVPLPPYIRRADDSADLEDYQTIFARKEGAVAAPTAGLHFTEELLSEIRQRQIEVARIVLHVGPGTFRPVRGGDIREHQVDSESYEISRETVKSIAATRGRGGRIVAVGTTTVRTLETVHDRLPETDRNLCGHTELTIFPPYRFRSVDVLMTNFHLPKSSLLLLVCAFGGRERVLDAYREAIDQGYRFYSYGDAMLVL